MATPLLETGPNDAAALWAAFDADASPDATGLRFTSTLQLDVAVARCCALHPLALPCPRFDAFVNDVKTALGLWR